MKLVDILARELKEWPEGILLAVQDADGEIKFDNSHELPHLNSSGDVWVRRGDEGDSLCGLATASDCATAIVTRAEWLAAVDALYPKLAEPEEWNGEGLPPVGTVCECKFVGQPDSHFTQVDIRYISDRHVIVFGQVETSHNTSGCVFRKIPTPEQIAAEERDKAVKAMLAEFEHTGSLTSHYEVCEVLHKAGYRKFEIVEGEE